MTLLESSLHFLYTINKEPNEQNPRSKSKALIPICYVKDPKIQAQPNDGYEYEKKLSNKFAMPKQMKERKNTKIKIKESKFYVIR